MKTDREFIEEIYVKAKQYKQQRKPSKYRVQKEIAAVITVALLASSLVFLRSEKEENQRTPISRSGVEYGNAESPLVGSVIEILEQRNGLVFIEVKVDTARSAEWIPDMITVAYEKNSETYEVGKIINVFIESRRIGEEEYFLVLPQ